MIETAPFRLAIRHEGDWVNAYLARLGTMEGAQLLGSVRLTLVQPADSAMFRRWKETMVAIFQIAIEALGASVESWHEQTAPEHERSGHG